MGLALVPWISQEARRPATWPVGSSSCAGSTTWWKIAAVLTRRRLLVLLVMLAVLLPWTAWAQPAAGKTYRLGILSPGAAPDPSVPTLANTLPAALRDRSE